MKTPVLLTLLLCCFLSTALSGQRGVPRFNYELQKDVYLNTVTLGLFHEREDYQLPGIGAGLNFTFYYNSTNLDLQYGYGFGWSFAYNWQYDLDQTGPTDLFTLYRGDGSVDEFTDQAGTWIAPTGVYDQLEEYVPDHYRLLDKSGTRYFFDDAAHRRLTSIVDRNGNTISISYTDSLPTVITDPAGRSIQLNYTDGLLTELRNDFILPNQVVTYEYDAGRRLTSVTDTEGNTTNYDYDEGGMSGISGPGGGMFTRKSKGGKTKKTKNQKNEQEAKEDPAKKLLKIIEGLTLKREVVFVRDTCNRIKTIKRGCCGGEQHLEYDGNNNITRITDADGNSTAHTYDPKGNRLTTTSPTGASESWTFEPTYNLPLSYTDPKGNSVNYTYDASGNLLSSTFPTHATTNTYNASGQVTSTTNGRGNTTTFTYNPAGYLTGITDALGQSTIYGVDAVGNTTSVTDPEGNTINYVFDSKRNITQFTDAAGNSSHFTYDVRGNQTSITDPLGNTINYTYDAFDRKIEETSATGRTSSWEYDAFDNVVRQTDAKGQETHFEYDGAGNLLRETDPLGYTTEFDYDSRGNVTRQTQPDGNTINYTYDGLNRQVMTTDAQGNTKSKSYDPAGNVSTTTDANGNVTTFTYDAVNRLNSVTTPLLTTTSYTFDANGNVLTILDALGGTTAMTYDALDRLISVTDPLNNTSTYTYNGASYLTEITDALGQTFTQVYDQRGLVVGETNAVGANTVNIYDAPGNLIATTQPNGRTVSYTFDGDYQLTAISDGDGTVASFIYDLNGNLITESNGLNQPILLVEYDQLDRVTRETDAAGNNSTYLYDANDNVVQATSKNGAILRYLYDERDLLLGEINQQNDTLLFIRDANGNIVDEVDENGNTTQYVYDALNRQTSVTYPDGSTATTLYDALNNPTAETRPDGTTSNYTYNLTGQLLLADHPGSNDDTYSYNALGQLTAASNPASALVFTYDATGRILTEALNGKTTTYAYNDATSELTLTYPGGRSIIQQLDQRGRLEEIREAGLPLATYTYDAADRLTGISYGNGVTTTQAYTPGQRMEEILHQGPGGALAGFQFQYNENGQLTAKDFLHQPDQSERLWYDANDRLARLHKGPVFADAIPKPTQREAFVYDGNGNRTFDQTNSAVRTWATNNSNQYLNNELAGTTTSIQYDGNGRLTDDGTIQYIFDHKDRLTSTTGGATTSYAYDPLGRRISKTVTGVTTNYYYDGTRVIEERNASDIVSATYVYGTALDDVVSMNRDGMTYYFHKDQQGSIILATGSDGTAAERYDYSAYGSPHFFAADFSPLSESIIGNPYLFTGRRYDEATSLYYYRERYYHPDMGRFLVRDPLGSLDGSNQYAFVGNDPANALDPLGTLKNITRWTPVRHALKWEEIGSDVTRTKGKTKTKYFKKQCCCIEASCDEFNLTTTTRFQAYQKFVKTNPRWWDMRIRLKSLFLSLKYDLINIAELTDILSEGNDEAFGLKAAAQDGIGLGLDAAGVNGAGTISKLATGDIPDATTVGTDVVGYGVGAGTSYAVGAGAITAGGTSALAAGGYAGLALAVGLTIGTKLKQAWTLWGLSSEIKEKVKKAEAKAQRLKKMVEEFERIEPYLRKYEKRTKSSSRTDRQKENFRARQVPLSKCR